MADVLNPTAWQEADASNGSGIQPSFPEGMPGKDVNNASRAMMGALKRWANQICATKVTAGTASAYTVAYTQAPEALYTGQRFTVIAHVACAANPNLNINNLGAKAIRKVVAGVVTDLAANDIGINTILDVVYISSLNAFIWLNPPPASSALVDASTTAKGIIEIATRAEAQAGTALLLALVPDTLGSLLFKGASIAGGTSISLADGGYFEITGTSFSCTSIVFATASALGRKALLKFVSAGGILVNGANLILPTGANITVAAGDTCEVVQEASGVYRVVNYQRFTGAPLLISSTGEVGVYKAADTARASSPSMTADPHLFFTAKATKIYDFEMYLVVSNAGATAGFEFQLNASTALGRVNTVVNSSDETLNGSIDAIMAAATPLPLSLSGLEMGIFVKGIIVGGAADSVVTLAWGQNTSSVSPTTLRANSYLKYLEH